MKLMGYLYNNDLDDPVLIDHLVLSSARISWSLPGGIQSISATARLTKAQAQVYMEKYLGYRVLILDGEEDQPVAEGFIYDWSWHPVGLELMAAGPWKRHNDELVTENPTNTQTTSEVIQDVLANHVPVISSDTTNIADTGTVIGNWQPRDGGEHPSSVIQKLAAMSDSQSRMWDYWVQSSPLQNGRPTRPLAFFQPRSTTASPDWRFSRSDLVAGSMRATRSIRDLANSVKVIYSAVEAGQVGQRKTTTAATDSDSQSRYWTREVNLSVSGMSDTHATQLRDAYLGKYKSPTLALGYTLSTPYVRDALGRKRPLWYVIKHGGGYVGDFGLAETSLAGPIVRRIVAAEYDYHLNRLRLVIDTADSRLDAVLARAGIR